MPNSVTITGNPSILPSSVGLWDTIVTWLVGDDEPEQAVVVLPAVEVAVAGDPDILVGRVDYVADRFAKIEGSWGRGVLFLNRHATEFPVDSMHEAVHEGESVEVVLLERSRKSPGEWILSLTEVTRVRVRVRVRAALAALDVGDRIKVRVDRVEHGQVRVDHEGLRGSIPVSELRHEYLDSCLTVVHADDELEVEILRIVWPDEHDWRAAPSLYLSAKRCLPEPPVQTVSMSFGVVPFHVHARPHLPRQFDPVARFALQELLRDTSADGLATRTALPPIAVAEILEVLVKLDLVDGAARPTRRGAKIVEAIALSEKVEAAEIGGVFASAAPQELAFSPRDDSLAVDWPQGFPRPLFVPWLEREFERATEEDVQGRLPLEQLAHSADLEVLEAAFAHTSLRVRIQVPRGQAARAIRLEVDEQWVLGLLWSLLEPAGPEPRPRIRGRQTARTMQLVELGVRDVTSGKTEMIYWEPATDTLWRPGAGKPQVKKLRAPEVPVPDGLAKRLKVKREKSFEIADKSWVVVSSRGRSLG